MKKQWYVKRWMAEVFSRKSQTEAKENPLFVTESKQDQKINY